MLDRLATVVDRFEHLTAQLSEPAVIQDSHKFRELSKERAALEELVGLARRYLELHKHLKEAEDLARGSGELATLAQEELRDIQTELPELERKIRLALLPKNPDDEKNIILEIRAGAGGDEASLFAQDLFRLYTKFCAKKGFQVEILSESFSDRGGYKEVSASVEGENVFQVFKYEAGVHRVQRVPTTEASGRIHTSTVTVAIMPEATEQEVVLSDKDLRIDVYRAGGKGGQGVNTTDSAVRITHLPTQTVVTCQDERSQIKNKAKAMKILRARLLAAQVETADRERAEHRRAQVGTGERNERIRTYNFPQERVTDHRIGLTQRNLSTVMEGGIESLIEALQQDDYARQLGESVVRPKSDEE